MGAVKDEKCLVGVAVTEMVPQQWQHPVFRLDDRPQHTVIVGEPHETPQLLQLSIHVSDGLVQRIAHRIGQILHEPAALLKHPADKGVEPHLLILHARQEGPLQYIGRLARPPDQSLVNPSPVSGVRHHGAHLVQG